MTKNFFSKLVDYLLAMVFVLLFSNFKNFNYDSKVWAAALNTLEPGVITCGTNATLKPFEYLNENNEIVGYDIDLIKKIAEDLGLKLKIVDMEFDALIPAIYSSKIDIAIAAMTKNPEREKIIAFSNPYYTSNQGVLTKKDHKFENEGDFNNKTIAVQSGTISQDTIEDLIKNKQKSINLKTYSDYITMVDDLLTSRLDAIVLDRDTGKTHQQLHKNELKYIDGKTFNWTDEENCIACSKQNKPLIDAINKQIETLKNGPFITSLINKYMGGTLNNSSSDGSHEKLSTNESANSDTGKNSKINNKIPISEQFKTVFLKNNRWKLYLKGLGSTTTITVFAALLGLTIGIVLALLQTLNFKKLNFLKFFFRLYVDSIRGTPLLLQLFILWFAIMKHSKNPILVAIIACGLNSGAYVCEIVRGAINSIDKGQTEAGLAIGFSPLQTLYHLVLPQSLKNSIPALCNEAISLLKETAIVGYIAIVDLTRAADQIRATTYISLMPLVIAAIIYFTLTKIASFMLGLLERKLKKAYD